VHVAFSTLFKESSCDFRAQEVGTKITWSVYLFSFCTSIFDPPPAWSLTSCLNLFPCHTALHCRSLTLAARGTLGRGNQWRHLVFLHFYTATSTVLPTKKTLSVRLSVECTYKLALKQLEVLISISNNFISCVAFNTSFNQLYRSLENICSVRQHKISRALDRDLHKPG
jgi:hypothetical protein